jgi:hypothetical protein
MRLRTASVIVLKVLRQHGHFVLAGDIHAFLVVAVGDTDAGFGQIDQMSGQQIADD